MNWFTADQHFDHEELIYTYCTRPFNKLHVHNRTLINNHNRLVNKDDIVYHLGDFTLRGPENKHHIERWVRQLNGHNILILGNHDKLKPFDYVDIGFESVHTYLKVGEFNLIHDPAVATVKPDELWLCGHVHRLFEKSRNAVNVGVDVRSFYPISEDELRKLYPYVNNTKTKGEKQ